MYPFLRFGKTLVQSSLSTAKGDRLELTEVGEFRFTANLSDIDNFFEMNNGRIFTLFDLGRIDFAIRSGLGKNLLKHRWGLVVAGSTIQYRRRIRTFDKVIIKTRVKAMDEKWIYIEQSMWVKGQACCQALLRTGVTNIKTGKVIDTARVLDTMGFADLKMPLDEWVQAWIEADKLRSFPKSD